MPTSYCAHRGAEVLVNSLREQVGTIVNSAVEAAFGGDKLCLGRGPATNLLPPEMFISSRSQVSMNIGLTCTESGESIT